MAKRIQRGWYKVRGQDGYWRVGHLLAGSVIRIAEGQWLERLDCATDLMLALPGKGMPVFVVSNTPVVVTFGPYEIARDVVVRRWKA